MISNKSGRTYDAWASDPNRRVRLVVADARPVHYLVLIERIEILAALFAQIVIATVVRDELTHAETPLPVRNWMESPPGWIEALGAPDPSDFRSSKGLDEGEIATIALAT